MSVVDPPPTAAAASSASAFSILRLPQRLAKVASGHFGGSRFAIRAAVGGDNKLKPIDDHSIMTTAALAAESELMAAEAVADAAEAEARASEASAQAAFALAKLAASEAHEAAAAAAAAAAATANPTEMVTYEVEVTPVMKPNGKYRIPLPSSYEGQAHDVVIQVPQEAHTGATLEVMRPKFWVDNQVKDRAATKLQAAARAHSARRNISDDRDESPTSVRDLSPEVLTCRSPNPSQTKPPNFFRKDIEHLEAMFEGHPDLQKLAVATFEGLAGASLVCVQ